MKVEDLFKIYKGKSYFKDFIEDENSEYDYITTSGKQNGVKCRVKYNPSYKIFEPGTITVAMQGSVLSSFVQEHYFYLQTHVAALIPKQPLTLRQKLFYTLAINLHAKEFNYGRKANTLLPTLEIPSLEEIPDWVETIELPPLYEGKAKNQVQVKLPNFSKWKNFKLIDLFDIHRGSGCSAHEAKEHPGNTPYIGSSMFENGVTAQVSYEPNESGNCITIAGDGVGVGSAFYQSIPFMALTNVNILMPKFELNASCALFICTLFSKNKTKYNYGRKLGLTRIKTETISLPVNEQGEPDWQLIEDYINSLPYSATL